MNKLLRKYRALPTTLKASLWFVAATLFQKGINIISAPIFTAIMTKEEYGSYAVFNTWYNIFLVLCTFNLFGSIFNTILHKYKEHEEEITSSTMGFQIVLTAVVFGVTMGYQLLGGRIQGMDTTLIVLAFVQVLVNIPTSLWLAKCKYQVKYLACCLVLFGQSLLQLGASVGAVYFFREKVIARIVSNVIVLGLVAAVVAFMIFRNSRVIFRAANWKYLFILGLPLVVHYLAQDVMSQADQIIIDANQGPAAVAEYNLAHQLAWIFTILITAVNTVRSPWTYKKMDAHEYGAIRRVSAITFTGISGVTVLVSLIAPELIAFFGHGNYNAGAVLIPLLISNVVIICAYDLFSGIEFFYGKTAIASVATILAAIINIVLNLIFIPKYGALAACLTTLISYFLMMFFHYVVMKIFSKKKGLPDLYHSTYIWLATLVLVGLNIATIPLQSYIALRYCILGGIVVLGVTLMVVFRHRISNMLQKKKPTEPTGDDAGELPESNALPTVEENEEKDI